MNIIKKLFIFQKERFPLRILIFTTISSVLASAAVSNEKPSILLILMAFFATLFFLFHIRVVDESRDMEKDSILHPKRPVQRGLIKIKHLFITSFIGLLINIGIAIYVGTPPLIISIAIIAFTYLTWKDFFAKKFFEKKPILYHIINSPQMILMQWNIYALFTNSFDFTYLMLIQMLLVYNSIFIIEIIRKIKAKSNDTDDTYSSQMGSKKSVVIVISMIFSGYLMFFLLLKGLETACILNLILGAIISLIAILFLILHNKKLTKTSENIMITAIVTYYVIINLIIYIPSVYGI